MCVCRGAVGNLAGSEELGAEWVDLSGPGGHREGGLSLWVGRKGRATSGKLWLQKGGVGS